MSKDGYFLLHRKILDNPLLNIKPFCKGYAWVTILALTNHKEGFMKVKNGTLVKVERGECGYSEKALAEIFGWSRGKVRRFLEQLKNDGMIQQKIVENRTIIEVLNYIPYQTIHQKNKKTDTKRYTKRTQTINDNKEDINKLISSSSIEEKLSQITEEEEELLKIHSKKNKIKYFKPWLRKILANGDYKEIVEKEKQIQQIKEEQRKKEEEEKRKQAQSESEVEEVDLEEIHKKIHEMFKRVGAKGL